MWLSGGTAEPEGENRESGRDDPKPGWLHLWAGGRYVEGTSRDGERRQGNQSRMKNAPFSF